MGTTTRLRSLSLLACFFACAAFAGPEEDSAKDFAAGKALDGLPDFSQPSVIKDGALVCENEAVFAANRDVVAARGEPQALEQLRTQCVNWHELSRVRVASPMSTVHRYDLARRFGVVEFTIGGGTPTTDATGFVRIKNLEPTRP